MITVRCALTAFISLCVTTAVAATFQVAGETEFERAMAIAATNGEDDLIQVATGVQISPQSITREPGYALTIEGGYEDDFSRRSSPTIQDETGGEASALPMEVPEPRSSTTGPTPPPDMVEPAPAAGGSLMAEAGGSMRVLGVPGYLWRHGCGPTAVGMALGYLDTRGYTKLFEGDASSQTEAVNQGIASQRTAGNPGHYEDYSLPDDNYPTVLDDRSEAPAGDEHISDSVADFMRTSWSVDGIPYGWSYSTYITTSFNSYVHLNYPDYMTATAFYSMPGSLTWSVLTNAIDNNRPMIFLVDTNADGSTDHFVTVVGYSDSPTRLYACLDTWNPVNEIRWCNFETIAGGVPWGIWGGWFLSIVQPAPGDVDHNDAITLTDAILSLQVISGQTPQSTINFEADVNDDNNIGLAESIYILHNLAE